MHGGWAIRFALFLFLASLWLPGSSAGTSIGVTGGPNIDSLETNLRGDELEGGDPDARGHAYVDLNHTRKKLCFLLTYRQVSMPVTSHIYRRSEGDLGSSAVTLFENSTESKRTEGCLRLKGPLRKEIADKPKRFFVDLHTPEHPGGALSCQLNYPGLPQTSRCVAPTG
jgi:hypothetical protein